VARAHEATPATGRARNVVLFLGDGMGLSTVTAARIFAGQQRGETGEENLLAFERLPYTALVKTYDTNQQVPDSAGTMTAIVTGEKTRAGLLSVNRTVERGDFRRTPGNELRTIFEQAEERGLATGLVTTTTVTHATPAALYAHCPERAWEDDSRLPAEAREAGFADIARQLVEFPAGDGIEVALGGGRQSFLPRGKGRGGRRLDGRDLLAEWRERRPGSVVVGTRAELLAVDPAKSRHLLGLFSGSHLSFAVDRGADSTEPSLAEMTASALTLLEKHEKGYVLMVEGGRIDHGHHAGNAYRALDETVQLDRAVQVALDRTDRSDTLILVTADHSHVLTIAGYPTRGNPILGKVVGNDTRGEPAKEYSFDSRGQPYTTLGYQNGPGAVRTDVSDADDAMAPGPTHADHDIPDVEGAGGRRPDLTDVDTTDPDYLQESAIPMAYETHGGEDVAVYATGPGAELLHGVREQHYLYHVMVDALGWNAEP
jgi:alkaline phosphatase